MRGNLLSVKEDQERRWKEFREAIQTHRNKDLMHRFGLMVRGKARQFAPYWRGGLKRSIYFRTTQKGFKVGNKVGYGAEQELGLGLPERRRVTRRMKQWARDRGYKRALNKKYWMIKKYTPHIRRALDTLKQEMIVELKNRYNYLFKKIMGG